MVLASTMVPYMVRTSGTMVLEYQLVQWYHGTHEYIWYRCYTCTNGVPMVPMGTIYGTHLYSSTIGTRVQIEHYLKNNLKYKHSGATGTLAS